MIFPGRQKYWNEDFSCCPSKRNIAPILLPVVSLFFESHGTILEAIN
jgi:hypothetical protein